MCQPVVVCVFDVFYKLSLSLLNHHQAYCNNPDDPTLLKALEVIEAEEEASHDDQAFGGDVELLKIADYHAELQDVFQFFNVCRARDSAGHTCGMHMAP